MAFSQLPFQLSFPNFGLYTYQTHKPSTFATKGNTSISQIIFHLDSKVSTFSLATVLEIPLHDVHPLIFKIFYLSRNRLEKKTLMQCFLYIQATEFSAHKFSYNGYKLLCMIHPSFISSSTLSTSAQLYQLYSQFNMDIIKLHVIVLPIRLCQFRTNLDKVEEGVCLSHGSKFPTDCGRINSWARHRDHLLPSEEKNAISVQQLPVVFGLPTVQAAQLQLGVSCNSQLGKQEKER